MPRRSDFSKKINQSIGDKIHHRRIEMGLSRTQLAKNLGVSQQQLQKYERGINVLSPERLVLLSKALNIAVEYFFEDVETHKPVKMVHTRKAMEVTRNFLKITNTYHQNIVHNLTMSLAKAVDEE